MGNMERGCVRDYKNNIYLPSSGGSCIIEPMWAWLFCTELTNKKPSLAHTLYFFSEVQVRKTGMPIGLSVTGSSLWMNQ